MKYIDILQAIGGILVVVFIVLVLGLIWFPSELLIKLMGSTVILIISVYILEKSHK